MAGQIQLPGDTQLIKILHVEKLTASSTIWALASLEDIDDEKVKQFVRIARLKRGFPLNEAEPTEKILTHLKISGLLFTVVVPTK